MEVDDPKPKFFMYHLEKMSINLQRYIYFSLKTMGFEDQITFHSTDNTLGFIPTCGPPNVWREATWVGVTQTPLAFFRLRAHSWVLQDVCQCKVRSLPGN